MKTEKGQEGVPAKSAKAARGTEKSLESAAPKISTPKITAKNLLKPESLWVQSIGRWESGDPEGVRRLLMGNEEIPAFAREWLSRALSGEIKKRQGRKVSHPTIAELNDSLQRKFNVYEFFRRQLIFERMAERTVADGTPKERAIAACSERFGISEDEVSHIVYPRKKRGTQFA